MIVVSAFAALLILAADTRNIDEEGSYDTPLLPKDPMVIALGKDDYYERNPPRIEYRGCHKFCVGTVEGRPDSDSVWNPYNLSADELYYFRYVKVNMRDCGWPHDEPQQAQILGLFFDDDNNDGYVISQPADKVTWNSFYFLVYNPESEPKSSFKVRWTSYMNVCDTDNTDAPIDTHFESNSFDPAEYVSVFQDHESEP